MQQAVRASIVHCVADPGEASDPSAYEAIDDGVLVIDDGRIAALGPASDLLPTLGDDVRLQEYPGKLVTPGLIDCHVHYAQLDVIGSYGEQLLDWLNRYAFPAEQRFSDAGYAREVAQLFVDELVRNGTTSAMVFATVHAHAADAIFEAAAARDMRLIAGKVLMDRSSPEALRDDAVTGYRESRTLIERWHGHKRLGYAITPRYALSSSEAQLESAGRLAREFPDAWIQTHLAENRDEVEAVLRQYPWAANYLDVYDQFGLVRERAVFAHCLHLTPAEIDRMAAAGASVAHCPTSNLFLGSGFFDLAGLREAAVPVGLGTDVGAGTSLSLLATMAESYKVLHLGDQRLPASRALYLATLGAAEALGLDDVIGNFEVGKEADFVVLDPAATALSTHRAATIESIDELLFALIVLGDDRHVAATWINGTEQAR